MKKHISVAIRPLQAIPAAAALLLSTGGQAAEISTDNPDVALRWDTTVKYSAASRLRQANTALLVNPNDDDGDRNFSKGLISNRIDLFSEFDVSWQKRLGLRASGAAFYDSVYEKSNDNPGFAGGAFPNQSSVAADRFTRATRNVHGRKAEVLDAFVFGKVDIADAPVTLRAGRHSLLWGESLFFGSNAIAGGQAPVDAVKLLSVPATQFKEAIRPVPQFSAQAQLSANVTLGAYVQAGWAKSRVPAVGSYFSAVDVAVDGAENLLAGPSAPPARRLADARPKNSGQGGIQLRLRGEETDYGFYAIRYHAKTPQVVVVLGPTPGGPGPTGFYHAYQQGITAFGASASRTFGDFNVAIEASIRHNQDLASSQAVDLSALTHLPATNNSGNPGYAVGKTAHVNISTISSLPATMIWREASLAAELAWNRVLRVTENAAAIDPNGTRAGAAARFVLEPTYRSVLPGVDIGVPIGAGWAPKGSRPLAAGSPSAWVPAGGGDLSVGLNGSFRDAWRFSMSMTHYFGTAAPFNDLSKNNAYTWKQSLQDRDFVAASLRYSF